MTKQKNIIINIDNYEYGHHHTGRLRKLKIFSAFSTTFKNNTSFTHHSKWHNSLKIINWVGEMSRKNHFNHFSSHEIQREISKYQLFFFSSKKEGRFCFWKENNRLITSYVQSPEEEQLSLETRSCCVAIFEMFCFKLL